MKTLSLWLVAVLGLALACASSGTPPPGTPGALAARADAGVSETGTPDAPFRQVLPAAGPQVVFRAPVPTVQTLRNGLAVWIVEDHAVPLATVELVVRAGEDTDPPGRPGTASFVADMLDEGTALRDASAIAAAFEDQAALFRSQSDKDSLIAAVSFPAASLTPVLDVFADCVLHPAFRRADLERVRALRLGDLAQLQADPAQIGKTVLDRTVFGDQSPWAFPSLGTVASIKAAGADQLSAWHRAWVRPNNAVLVVVGDVHSAELLPELERRFGGWTKAALPKRRSVAPAAGKGPRVVTVVDRPGAAQSQLWVGELGVGASSPDLYAAQVASTVLGGGFKSRLNANLRSGKGYSYGAYSAFDVRREPGLFIAAAPVVADKTAEALRELLNENRPAPRGRGRRLRARRGQVRAHPEPPGRVPDHHQHRAGLRAAGLARAAPGVLRPVRPEAGGRHPGGRRPGSEGTLRHQDARHRGGGAPRPAPGRARGAGSGAHRPPQRRLARR